MNVRLCFKPVRLGGGKDEPKSTYELFDIDDRILRDYRSYLATGQPVGGAYGENAEDAWFHVDFREVAFIVPIEKARNESGHSTAAAMLAGMPSIPGLIIK